MYWHILLLTFYVCTLLWRWLSYIQLNNRYRRKYNLLYTLVLYSISFGTFTYYFISYQFTKSMLTLNKLIIGLVVRFLIQITLLLFSKNNIYDIFPTFFINVLKSEVLLQDHFDFRRRSNPIIITRKSVCPF